MFKKILGAILCAIILTACGSHKNIAENTTNIAVTGMSIADQQKYISQVKANAVGATDIVSKVDFSIEAMGKSISVDGKLQMRRDKVIRITLFAPILGFEVARLEFAKDHVLLVDRMNKQYVRAPYTMVDFLKNNGIDFYTMQSLFWNELFLPSRQSLTDDDLKHFSVDITTDKCTVKHDENKFSFSWDTTPATALINKALIEYGKGSSDVARATCEYGSFTKFNGKQFPSAILISFVSKAFGGQKMTLDMKLGKLSSDSSWDTETSIPSKYKEVTAEQLFSTIGSF